jgi:hypothetical protein
MTCAVSSILVSRTLTMHVTLLIGQTVGLQAAQFHAPNNYCLRFEAIFLDKILYCPLEVN